MKTAILFLLFSLLSLQGVYSQVSTFKANTLENETTITLYPNPAQDVLYIKSNQTIDLVKLFNQRGEVVFQSIPEDNQIALTCIQSGFYLFCAYINGVKVKKGILKKV